tara:strand:- start:40167 stop:40427 length:261 start_codon:yes stop_codon:yes gene_type:complete
MTQQEKDQAIEESARDTGAASCLMSADRVAVIYSEEYTTDNWEATHATILTRQPELNQYDIGRPLLELTRFDSTEDEFIALVKATL